jgi:valine--pyruvate aminotransferase
MVIRDNTAAMCVSRPTNPTGNVLSDAEIARLSGLAEEYDIPFIIDNAYGEPFPNIIFTDTNPVWNKNIIYCMSLSKVGLPGTRTGIVIADEPVISLIRNMNAVINLATANFGAMIATDLISSGEILRLSQLQIKPYYQAKVEHAVDVMHREFTGLDYYIHRPEGAIFLWLWLPGLPISADELYERLKAKGVIVISGSHFFPGLEEDWEHKQQCLRITYSMDENIVEQGIKLIAEELRNIS